MIVTRNDKEVLSIRVGDLIVSLNKVSGFFVLERLTTIDKSKSLFVISPDDFPEFLQAARTCMNAHKGKHAAEERETENS